MVGATGFEPATPCSQSRCATGLRHAPTGLPRDGRGRSIRPDPGPPVGAVPRKGRAAEPSASDPGRGAGNAAPKAARNG